MLLSLFLILLQLNSSNDLTISENDNYNTLLKTNSSLEEKFVCYIPEETKDNKKFFLFHYNQYFDSDIAEPLCCYCASNTVKADNELANICKNTKYYDSINKEINPRELNENYEFAMSECDKYAEFNESYFLDIFQKSQTCHGNNSASMTTIYGQILIGYDLYEVKPSIDCKDRRMKENLDKNLVLMNLYGDSEDNFIVNFCNKKTDHITMQMLKQSESYDNESNNICKYNNMSKGNIKPSKLAIGFDNIKESDSKACKGLIHNLLSEKLDNLHWVESIPNKMSYLVIDRTDEHENGDEIFEFEIIDYTHENKPFKFTIQVNLNKFSTFPQSNVCFEKTEGYNVDIMAYNAKIPEEGDEFDCELNIDIQYETPLDHKTLSLSCSNFYCDMFSSRIVAKQQKETKICSTCQQ